MGGAVTRLIGSLYDGRAVSRETIKAHVNQINDRLAETDYRIISMRGRPALWMLKRRKVRVVVTKQLTLLEGKGSRQLEQFDPDRFRLTQAALDYGIEEAKRIKDWPALEESRRREDRRTAEIRRMVEGEGRSRQGPKRKTPRSRRFARRESRTAHRHGACQKTSSRLSFERSPAARWMTVCLMRLKTM